MSDLEEYARYLFYCRNLKTLEDRRKRQMIETLRGPSERRAHERYNPSIMDLSELPGVD